MIFIYVFLNILITPIYSPQNNLPNYVLLQLQALKQWLTNQASGLALRDDAVTADNW